MKKICMTLCGSLTNQLLAGLRRTESRDEFTQKETFEFSRRRPGGARDFCDCGDCNFHKSFPPAAPQWYQIAADDAFDNRNYRTAAVCYQRLLQGIRQIARRR